MQAFEILGKVDENGHLTAESALPFRNSAVKIIVFKEERDALEDDRLWLRLAAQNPAFDFLHDPEEDIYTLDDIKIPNEERLKKQTPQ